MKKLPFLLTAIVCGLCSVANASMGDYPETLGWEESFLYYNASLVPNATIENPRPTERYIDGLEANAITAGYIPTRSLPMAGVGMGFRQRLANQLGWDAAFNIKTAGTAHKMDVSAIAHYYLQATRQDSMYIGTGLKLGSTWTNDNKKLRHFWCVDSVVGKVLATETDTKHFVEMHLECPTRSNVVSNEYPYTKSTKLRAANPVVYLTYGMAF